MNLLLHLKLFSFSSFSFSYLCSVVMISSCLPTLPMVGAEEHQDRPANSTSSDDPSEEMDQNAALPAEHWLVTAHDMVSTAVAKAKTATSFISKWKPIVSKLDRLPPCLSDLATHPFFSKNSLCKEQLQSMCRTLTEVIGLAELCAGSDDGRKVVGKLQMQSDLDAVLGKLDLNIRDCRLLVKTGVLGEVAPESSTRADGNGKNVGELLARLQIGNVEAKHRAVDGLLELMKEEEKRVLSVLRRSNVAAIIQLLSATTTTYPKIREKAATLVRLLAESDSCEDLIISEGVVPALVKLVESGGSVGMENAVISLQKLSISPDTAKMIVKHGGIRPLIEICMTGDSVSQAAAAGTLKNLSAVPEARHSLTEEGIVRVMLNLIDCGLVLASKEYAADCLEKLTSANENLRRSVVAEGGMSCLLAYLDGPLPQESAVAAVRNLVNSVSMESLVGLGLLPRIVHVLRVGSVGAQQAAASAVCKISNSMEMKKLVGEFGGGGILPLLVRMLGAKTNGAREVAAQALSSLMCYQQNAREVRRDEKSVPSLVQLLEHSPHNTAKKYAVSCLLCVSYSKKCKKLMISYGAIGYLKKLVDMDVPGSKKLLERLEKGKLRSFFFNRKR